MDGLCLDWDVQRKEKGAGDWLRCLGVSNQTRLAGCSKKDTGGKCMFFFYIHIALQVQVATTTQHIVLPPLPDNHHHHNNWLKKVWIISSS